MKLAMLMAVMVGLLIVLFATFHRSQPPNQLNVDPHAAGEIEKAKRR